MDQYAVGVGLGVYMLLLGLAWFAVLVIGGVKIARRWIGGRRA